MVEEMRAKLVTFCSFMLRMIVVLSYIIFRDDQQVAQIEDLFTVPIINTEINY